MIPGLLLASIAFGIYLTILAHSARKISGVYRNAMQEMHNERIRHAYSLPDALRAILKADTEDAA